MNNMMPLPSDGLFCYVPPHDYQQMFNSKNNAFFLVKPTSEFEYQDRVESMTNYICGEEMLYPFVGKIGPSLRIGSLPPGRLLWSRVFENSTKEHTNMDDIQPQCVAISDKSVPLKNSSLSSESNLDEPIKDDFKIDSIEYDSQGNLIGPFLISRKKQDTKFSTRQDVVNKTLIRALKKYYTHKFRELSKTFVVKCNSASRHNVYLNKFVNTYITKESLWMPFEDMGELNENEEIKGEECESQGILESNKLIDRIRLFVKSIIDASKQHKIVNNIRVKYLCKLFYECLYNYSHKKLETLAKYEEFCILFVDFYKSQKFEGMKETDPTLKRYHEVYEKAARELVQSILKRVGYWK